MCRLYGFSANEPTKVDCSLVFSKNALMQQSRVDQVGRDHTDGWGIATYQNGQPEVHKKSTAAYNDRLFSTTADSSYSTVIVAHVRLITAQSATSLARQVRFAGTCGQFASTRFRAGFSKA